MENYMQTYVRLHVSSQANSLSWCVSIFWHNLLRQPKRSLAAICTERMNGSVCVCAFSSNHKPNRHNDKVSDVANEICTNIYVFIGSHNLISILWFAGASGWCGRCAHTSMYESMSVVCPVVSVISHWNLSLYEISHRMCNEFAMRFWWFSRSKEEDNSEILGTFNRPKMFQAIIEVDYLDAAIPLKTPKVLHTTVFFYLKLK